MKAADIPDAALLRAIEDVIRENGSGWACWGFGAEDIHIGGKRVAVVAHHFPGVPHKVLLAKARRLLKRGLVTGCACGCRGDFELTAAGEDVLHDA